MTNYFQLAFSPGMPEILLVLAVILIFFGAKKLPELAKGMESRNSKKPPVT